MCFASRGVFLFQIINLTCEECGATEGWKEVGEKHQFRFLNHLYISGYGVVDEAVALTGDFICPGCGGRVDSHYIDCDREGYSISADVVVEVEEKGE